MPAHPKYRPEFVEQARKLAEMGLIDAEIAEFFEVSVRAFHQWKSKFPEFAAALKVGKHEPDERVTRAMFQNAVGYTDPDGKHYRPDTVAGIFWLKNRRPEEWRENFDGDRIDKDKLARLLSAVEGRLAELEETSAPQDQPGSGPKPTH